MTQVSAVRDRKVTAADGVSNPVPIDYPDLVENGDLLVLWATGHQSIPSATGWTKPISPTVWEGGQLFYRTADGTEGGTTFDITQSVNGRDSNCIVWSIKGDLNPGTPEAAQVGTLSTTTPVDPPSLSPSGGNRLYLWLVCVTIDGSVFLTTWDSTLEERINRGGLTGISVGAFSGERLLEAATFDPASMSKSGNQEWSAFTVAIPVDTPPASTFPVVESTSQGSWDTAAGTQTLTLPAGVASGDLLVATVSTATAGVTIDGWTVLDEEQAPSSTIRGTMLQRTADGSEGATVTVDLTASEGGSYICRRISGADGTKTEVASTNTVGSALPAWPALTPTGGSDTILWLAEIAIHSDRRLIGWPANYGAELLLEQDLQVVSEGAAGGVLARAQASASPPTGRLSGGDNSATFTVAIYPASPQFTADLAEEVDEAFEATFDTIKPFTAELAEEVDEAFEATLGTAGVPTGGAFDTNVTVIVEIAPGDGPLTAAPTWVPVADYVRGASWTRGRSSVQSDFPAGRGRVLLDNSDGRFYSWNTASPYFPDITVGVPIRIRAVHDSVIYDLFRGYVSRWPWEFPTNSEELAVAEMVETYTNLEGKKVSGSYAAASTDARIGAVLDSAGWPGGLRDLDSGIADVAAITVSSQTALTLLRQAEEAEQGQVFQGADGALVLRNRVASSGASSQATFGPDGVELIYTDVTATEDDDLLWNEARVTGSDGVEQEAVDATSITAHGPRTFDSTNPSIVGSTGALNVAEWVVGRHADILRRITGLEIDPAGDPDTLWPEVLSRELRDVVTVEVSFPGSSTQLVQAVAVESVSHSFEVGGVWTVAYGCHPLSDLEQATFFTIGVSQLDGTHILG